MTPRASPEGGSPLPVGCMLPGIVSKYKSIISWCVAFHFLEMASSGLDFRLSAVGQISVYYRNSDATLLFPHCLILTPVSWLSSVSAPSLNASI